MLCDFACSSPLHNWRPMSSKSQIENPSFRASIVAMLFPCMYSMGGTELSVNHIAPDTLVILGLARILVRSASANSACSRAPRFRRIR